MLKHNFECVDSEVSMKSIHKRIYAINKNRRKFKPKKNYFSVGSCKKNIHKSNGSNIRKVKFKKRLLKY